MTTRGRRRAPSLPRFRVSLSARNWRATLAGVALGISIGSVSVLIALDRAEETSPSSRRTREPQQPSQSTALQHEALRYGAPSSGDVLVREGYVVAYDYRTRNASWVLEHLTRDSLRQPSALAANRDDASESENGVDRAKSTFAVDTATPAPFRVHPSVFLKSGFDKGHLAPARDMTQSQYAMDESFLMTNISPQVGAGFNRSYWARLERFVRDLTHTFDAVYVVTGPLFLPTQNKKTGVYHVKYALVGTPPDAVAVPTHFFKVVLARSRSGVTFATAGFVLPNRAIADKTPLTDFVTPIDEIEKLAGLLFFNELEATNTRALCHETTCALAKVYRRAVALTADKMS